MPNTVDKNQAVIDFLIQNEDLQNSSLYFNFVNASDDDKQIVTLSNDTSLARSYIDGSVRKQYTFMIICFKSITDSAIVTIPGYQNENLADVADMQSVIDWVNSQNKLKNFPDFGEYCKIESISTTTDNPVLEGINTEVTPTLAMYSISIQIEYIDISDRIWR